MTYEIKGRIARVGETKTFGSGFTKRECVIETDPDNRNGYTNPVAVNAKKTNCSILDGYKEGDDVTATIAIDGRRWDGPNGTKYFVDLTLLKIVGEKPAPEPEQKQTPPEEYQPSDPDVLPF